MEVMAGMERAALARKNVRPIRLSVVDMINLAVETRTAPMTIGAVLIIDGRSLCDTDGRLIMSTIRTAIDRSLTAAPPMHRVLHRGGPLAGRPIWIDDPAFRIDRHVLQSEVPPPGDEAALLRLAARLMAGVLDRAHPLWRMWFVTGLPEGRVAVIVKMHHVLADGLAAIQLITSMFDASVVDAQAPAGPWLPAPAPGWYPLVVDNARARLAALRWLASGSYLQRLVLALRGHWRVLSAARGAARTSLTAAIGPRRRLAVVRLDLAEARRVAHRHGGKVNDVVLSLATAGVRALLRSRAEPVDGLWLHVSVAVSTRTPGQAAESGNRTGGMVVRLPCGEPDPRMRLASIAALSAHAKNSQLYSAGNVLLAWLARLGIARWFSRRQRMVHLVESDLAGPSAPITLLGAPVLDLIPIGGLAGNLAISFLAVSYAGQLAITVHADADRFPDLPVLVSAMWHDWTALSGHPCGHDAA